MQCSNCGHDMISSSSGWLCLNCGHTQPKEGAPVVAKSLHDQKPKLSITNLQPKSTPKPASPEPAKPDTTPIPVSVVKPSPASEPVKQVVEHDTADVPTPPDHAAASGTALPPKLMTTADDKPLMPVSHDDAAPVPTPTPATVMPGHVDEQGKPKSRRRRKLMKLIFILVIILLLIGGAAFKFLWLDPRNAPVSYIKKVVAAKTGNVQASVTYSATGDSLLDGSGTGTVSGIYDFTDKTTARVDMTASAKFADTSVSAHVINVPKTLYFQVSANPLLALFGVKGGPEWYKINNTATSSSTAKCSTPTDNKTGSYFGFTLPTEIPVKKARRVGVFETIAGHRTTHYRGEIDFVKLQSIVDNANKGVAADCKISFNKNDYKDMVVSYNLWTSKSFDRVELKAVNTVDKTTVTGTIDSSKYDEKVTITAPANAKSFTTDGFLGGTLSDSSFTSDTLVADMDRKEDLKTVKAALEGYYNENAHYPGGDYAAMTKVLSSGSKPYLREVPVDPKAGQSYSYTPSPVKCTTSCTGYRLDAQLDDKKDPDASADGLYSVSSLN